MIASHRVASHRNSGITETSRTATVTYMEIAHRRIIHLDQIPIIPCAPIGITEGEHDGWHGFDLCCLTRCRPFPHTLTFAFTVTMTVTINLSTGIGSRG
jgi:hypothetical protein